MMIAKATTIVFIFIAFISSTSDCHAANEELFIPWNFNNVATIEKPVHDDDISLVGHILISGVKFYQVLTSPVKSGGCPMYPTCSAYGIQAIKKHGAFIGFIMTADRLLHESNEMNITPFVKIGNRFRYYDPVSNNDFWWHK